MDPVQYMIHLIEQGKPAVEARDHAKLRYGLSDEAIDARILEAHNAAVNTINALRSLHE